MLAVTEPVEWLVLFSTKSRPWVERLVPGRFKHVSLLGFVPDAMAWTHLSWELGRIRVSIVADKTIEPWLAATTADAGVLRMPAPDFDIGPWRPRLGLSCCSMAAHVLGIRGGALWPDSLWRLLVAHGAEIITDGRPHPTEDQDSRTVGGTESR